MEAKLISNDVFIRTENPFHEGELKWIIDNASKFSRRLRSWNFSLQKECEPEFQVVARFNDRYPEVHVTNVHIGIQRMDSGDRTVYVNANAQLLNLDGDEYCRKDITFTCSGGGAPFYIFSELFSDSAGGLTLSEPRTGISSNDNQHMLHLQLKNLVAFHGNVGPIFIMPEDTLVVKVHIKIFGCCIITNEVKVPDVPKRQTPRSHVDLMVRDFLLAYQREELTDIELVVEDKVIKAHKFVLQARSPVFRNMLDHNLTETTHGTIQINDLDYPILQALIWYLYTAEVLTLPFVDVCDLYEAADKYQISSLQKECTEILKSFLSENTACRTLVLADMHNDQLLRAEAVGYICRNFAEVKLTEEWELTMRAHQRIAADVLEKVCSSSAKTRRIEVI
ncbi:TD and POZ domain-containing protein 3-like [Argiope bruennichi]|uniref:TD and POZ domain-containing protein 3 n=1 Tax=Argiope bruennichi TaxID=94029 RepID=A0A8T0FCI7_ARGBR|nr:TD and POZ domain-containing protein 3-like [Argiope bruennichi]KAF8788836.1 TD and POZ domain-containing protein 3 [Argiope bruennichi]